MGRVVNHPLPSSEHDTPLVSVIMNCFNCAQYLQKAIDSVYSQDFTHWEIIFWDNASSDDSANIAKSYDSRLKYFCSPGETVDLGRARNLAIEKSIGKYIAFLDCDDYWTADKLSKQIALFKNEKLGLAFSNAQRLFQHDDTKVLQWSRSSNPHPRGDIFSYILTDYPIVLSAAMVRRKAIVSQEQIFDPSLNYAEEYDLFLRIAHRWQVDYVDDPLTVLRIHSESVTQKRYNIMESELNIILEKLGKLIPSFNDIYKKEVAEVLKSTAYTVGIYYYRDHKTKEARKKFFAHITKPKFFITYLSTFLFKYQTLKTMQTFLKRLLS
jgi:glycosyltransferase involved in cell wall biosynthesis